MSTLLYNALHMTEKKFNLAYSEMQKLDRQIQDMYTRFNRAKAGGQSKFMYTIRLRLSVLEGIRNMLHEYVQCMAFTLDALQKNTGLVDVDETEGTYASEDFSSDDEDDCDSGNMCNDTSDVSSSKNDHMKNDNCESSVSDDAANDVINDDVVYETMDYEAMDLSQSTKHASSCFSSGKDKMLHICHESTVDDVPGYDSCGVDSNESLHNCTIQHPAQYVDIYCDESMSSVENDSVKHNQDDKLECSVDFHPAVAETVATSGYNINDQPTSNTLQFVESNVLDFATDGASNYIGELNI